MPGKRTNKKHNGYYGVITGTIITFLTVLLLLSLISLLLRNGSIGRGGIRTAVLISIFVSSAMGCLISAFKSKSAGTLVPLIPSGVLILFLLIGRFLSSTTVDLSFTWLLAAAAALPGFFMVVKRSRGRQRDYRR